MEQNVFGLYPTLIMSGAAVLFSFMGYKYIWNMIFKGSSGAWETWESYQARTKGATEHHKYKHLKGK